jgi:hypothetical protein
MRAPAAAGEGGRQRPRTEEGNVTDNNQNGRKTQRAEGRSRAGGAAREVPGRARNGQSRESGARRVQACRLKQASQDRPDQGAPLSPEDAEPGGLPASLPGPGSRSRPGRPGRDDRAGKKGVRSAGRFRPGPWDSPGRLGLRGRPVSGAPCGRFPGIRRRLPAESPGIAPCGPRRGRVACRGSLSAREGEATDSSSPFP